VPFQVITQECLVFLLIHTVLVSDCLVPGNTCALGTFLNTSSNICSKCPAGKYSSGGNATICLDCPPGKYAVSLGKSSCVSCPINFYSKNSGASSCDECGPSFSAFAGSSSCVRTSVCSQFRTLSGASPRSFKAVAVNALDGNGDFFHARVTCQALTHGSDVAMIDDEEILSLLSNDTLVKSTNASFWVGLNLDESLTYRWVKDNSKAPFVPWCDEKPFNFDGQRQFAVLTPELCLADVSTDDNFPFVICEMDARNCDAMCVPGTFTSLQSSNTTSCFLCPPGKYSEGYAVSSCTDCPLGRFSGSSGMTVCTECGSGSYSDQKGSKNCNLCPQGAVTASGVSGSSSIFDCFCTSGSFGHAYNNESCQPCLHHYQSCGQNFSQPFINSGFLVDSQTQSVYSCSPPGSCLSTGFNNFTECDEGYQGRKCGSCKAGFIRSNGSCSRCGAAAFRWCIYILFSSFIVYGVYRISKQHQSKTPPDIKIMIASVQMISLLPSMFSNWPSAVKNVFSFLSITSLDLFILSPECSFPLSFWDVWILKLNIPFFLILSSFLLLFGFSWFRNRRAEENVRQDLRSAMCRAAVTILLYTYIYMVTELFKPLSCSKDLDGTWSLQYSPDLKCFDPSWAQYVGTLCFYIFIYVFLLPVILAILFFKYRRNIADQWFASRFGSLCSPFKPSLFWWEFIVLLKKSVYSITSNVFLSISSGFFRYFAVIGFLLVFLMLDVIFMPYNSRSRNQINLLYNASFPCLFCFSKCV
jgi:hypothetical protein